MKIRGVRKYDKKLFKILFDLTSKINIDKIRIELHSSLSNKNMKNLGKKLRKEIISLETRDINSEIVSFLWFFLINNEIKLNEILNEIKQTIIYNKLTTFNINLQITIEVQDWIQDGRKRIFEAKVTKGKPQIYTNRFVINY